MKASGGAHVPLHDEGMNDRGCDEHDGSHAAKSARGRAGRKTDFSTTSLAAQATMRSPKGLSFSRERHGADSMFRMRKRRVEQGVCLSSLRRADSDHNSQRLQILQPPGKRTGKSKTVKDTARWWRSSDRARLHLLHQAALLSVFRTNQRGSANTHSAEVRYRPELPSSG